MRILFSCHGAYGHFHPIAPLALAAQEKGHDVIVATGPDLVEWVATCGLQAAPVGLRAGDMEAKLAASPWRTNHSPCSTASRRSPCRRRWPTC